MSSKFERDHSPVSTKEKTSRMGSDKSLGYEKTSGEILGEEEARKKLGKSENLGMRNREILESSKKATNNCWSETQVSKYRESPKWTKNEMKKGSKKLSRANKTPEERVNATHETLHQVCQKLENLHSVLRIYGQPTSEKNPANQELAETILRELKNLGNFAESETDAKPEKSCHLPEGNGDSNSEEFSKKEENPVAESSSEFEQCRSEPDFSSSSNGQEKIEATSPSGEQKNEEISKTSEATNLQKNIENGQFSESIINREIFENGTATSFQKKCEKEYLVEKNDSKVPETGDSRGIARNLENDERKKVEFSKIEKIVEKQEIASMSEEQTIPSPISSTAEFSKDSDTDEKSNASLLREAVKFKNALIDQMEMENASASKLTSTRSGDESESDETVWSKSKLHFQPKILDIISEEHSASSSTEKGIKVREKKNAVENSGLKKIESNGSSLKMVESKSSLKIGWEKCSECREDLARMEKAKKDEKMGLAEEEKSVEEAPRDLTSLVNESVQNIREYIEAYSQMQKEAIVETKMSLREEKNDFLEENPDFSSIPEEKSSLEGITRFMNPVALTMSEELPRKLSEPLTRRLEDSELETSEEDSSLETRRVDLSLRRRPGSTSLAEAAVFEEKSIFESANSLDDYEDDITSDFSCKRLNDYSSQSASDVTNEKQFEKDFDERSRLMDSPLTGRTVIRATGSSTSNLELSTNENKSVKSLDYEKTEICGSERSAEAEVDRELNDLEESPIADNPDRFFQPEVVQETSSTYFTDQASFPDIGAQLLEISDQKFELEDDHWLYEEKFSTKPEVELENEVSISKMEMRPENSAPRSKLEKTDDFLIQEPEIEKPEPEDREDNPEVDKKWSKIREKTSKINEATNEVENNLKNDATSKEEPEVMAKNRENRPNSSETFVINSPRTKSRTSDISNLLTDSSTLYVDANSREFLNASGTSLCLEKGILGSSKSARGSCSLPLRQSVPWNTPRRGSSLTSSEKSRRPSEKLEKAKETLKNSKNLGNSIKEKNWKTGAIGLAAKNHLALNGTKDLESSSLGRRNVNSNVDLRDRRSRSYATPRKSDFSPRSLTNSDFMGTQRPSRGREAEKSVNIDAESEKNKKETCRVDFESARESSRINSPRVSICDEIRSGKNAETVKKCKIDCEDSAGSLKKNFASFSSCRETEKLGNAEIMESPSLSNSESREMAKNVKSTRSTTGLSKNMSKSSIPVLRSRLEAVRQTGQEKRSKSPSRCALTMSTSSWSQENRSLPIFSGFEKKSVGEEVKMESRGCDIDSQSLGSVAEAADSEMRKKTTSPESRTVIYVNIVTEQEHKSATRIVDPKKFLEYLKDRDLKIQSVQDQEIAVERVETSSPRILTIVSSAVEEKMKENSRETSRAAGWSLRVEKREIEVSAKPSVIDTSTSISDLPETIVQPPSGDSKFQIFQVPKELTKDEYIVLLETLNQDPNLHQLRQMHYLCNKLGLGFNE